MLIDEMRNQEEQPESQTDAQELYEQALKPQQILQWSISAKGRSPAHVGCKIVHPNGAVGEIVEGASNMTFVGKKVARIGDKVRCPGHEGVILQGTATVSLGEKPIARIGDKTSCGGVIVEGFPTITVLDKTFNACGEGNREIRFKLTQSSHAIDNSYIAMPYQIYVDGGKIGEGLTDEDGELILLMDDKKDIKEYEIRFANGRIYSLILIDAFQDNTEKDKITPRGFPAYDDLGIEYAKAYDDVASGKLNTGWKK